MDMRCLFTCIFAFSLCSGYAQNWKGVVQEVIRRAINADQSKDVRVPQVDDTVAQMLASSARKEVLFRDSMLSIAKTDTFGIVCQIVSKRIKPTGLKLSDIRKDQYVTCIDYLIKELILYEKAYQFFLKEGVSKQTVESLRQIALRRKEKMKDLHRESK